MILDPEFPLWNEKLKRLRKNEKKQTISISIAAGSYDTETIIDLINQTVQDFRIKYQESSIGFENLAYLQSTENKCNSFWFGMFVSVILYLIKKISFSISSDMN